MHINSNIV